MRRPLLAAALLIVAAAVVSELVLRDTAREPNLGPAHPTAMIGSGSGAVGVSRDGTVLAWMPLPRGVALPRLPLAAPPRNRRRLAGPMLQQALVLGAAPKALRPHLESSSYGESGVDVMLRSGIELRFGDASNLKAKWRSAAAVLADPSITALSYVDLEAPSRPAISGSAHSLPPPR